MIKTYRGPFVEGVDVVVAGESFGLVKPGESIAVPDELAEQVAWPESNWSDGPAKKREESVK
jgi:hypothetical protein